MSANPSAASAPPSAVVCPFCASTDTELFALFGQFLLASQYYCRACHTVFDVVRWDATDNPPDNKASQPGATDDGVQ